LAVSKIKKCPKGQRFADIPAMWQHNCEVFWKMIFKTVSGCSTIISQIA
jgi:hypothetical protein